LLSKFYGLNQTQAGDFIPPDVQVATGTSYVVEAVNVEGAVFTKQGSFVQFLNFSSMLKVPSCTSFSDPKILYDSSIGRWFFSIIQGNCQGVFPGNVTIAISTSGDPRGSWNPYVISLPLGPYSNGELPDQPILGLSDDKVVVTANVFTAVEARNGQAVAVYLGDQYWALSKAEMLAGFTSVDFASFGPFSSQESVHPVQSLSSTATEYMVSVGAGEVSSSTSTVQLYSITGASPGVVTVNPVLNLHISGVSIPVKGLQPGTTSVIDSGDQRVLDAAWFQGKLWFGLDTSCTPTGDNTTRACIRLTQIDTIINKVVQDMNFSAKGFYYFYPALRIDSQGGLDLVYGYSSQTNSTCCYPSLAVTGQGPSDPINTLASPTTLIAGTANDTSDQHTFGARARYGDYFGAAVDPSDTTLVWVAGEFHNLASGDCWSGNCWSTFIGSMKVAGFSISPTPNYLNLAATASGTSAITVASLGGFSGTVSLTASVSPTGPTASLSPTSVSLSAGGKASSTLTVSTKRTPSGLYSVTVTGSSGSKTYKATVSVTVGADFSTTASPTTITIQPGSSTTSSVTLTSLNSFTGNVTLSTIIPVAGPTASLSPTSRTLTTGGSASSTLTVSTTTSTATGTYQITVNATSGSLFHAVSITVKVTDFAIAALPSNLTFPTFTAFSGVSIIRIVSLNGFSGTISLSVSTSPAGFSTSLSSNTPLLTANQTSTAALTISATASVSPGTYTFTTTGSTTMGSTTISHSTVVSVFIPSPDFTISSSPSFVQFNLGASGTFTITLTSLNKFSGNVTLSAPALSGVSFSFNPGVVVLAAGKSANSTLTVSASISAAPGVYIVSITGASGSLSHTTSIEFSVAGFTISASPTSLTFGEASSGTSTIIVQSFGGFSQNVTLSATVSNATIPNRPTAMLNPTVVVPPGYSQATSTLTVSAGTSTPPGSYTVTVNASSIISGQLLTKTVTISVIVPPPDFSISASPTTFSMTAGSSGTSTITVTSLFNFAGTVTLSVSAPGMSASLNPSSLTLSAYGTATSTLSVSGSTLGTFTATVTGTSGSLSHANTITVGVGGTVCIADISQASSFSSCPGLPGWNFDGPFTVSPTQLKIGVFVSGSGSFNLFEATLVSDSTILRPISVDLTGSVIGNPSFLEECIGGFGGGCGGQDNFNTVSVAAFILSQTPSPTTGLLFAVTYNITGITTNLPLSFQINSACSGESVFGTNTCVFLSLGSSAIPETVQTATFTSSFTQASVALSSSRSSLGPVPAYTTATANITATSQNGFPGIFDTGSVTFTTTQTSGLGASLNPSSVTLTPGSSASTILTVSAPAAGTYSVTLYGTYTVTDPNTALTSTLSATLTLSVTVTDFKVSVSPTSLSFNAGSTSTSTVTVTSLNGFAGTVTLAAVSIPAGVTVTFNPSSVTLTAGGSASSTATFSSSTPSKFSVSIRGTSGTDTRSVIVSVTVMGFSLSASPTFVAVQPGSSGASIVTASSVNSFTGTITLSTAVSPSGVKSPTASLSSTSITLTAGGKGNSTLTISTTSRTNIGFYNITVTGKSGSETVSLIIQVCVGSPILCVTGSPSPQASTLTTQTSISTLAQPITQLSALDRREL